MEEAKWNDGIDIDSALHWKNSIKKIADSLEINLTDGNKALYELKKIISDMNEYFKGCQDPDLTPEDLENMKSANDDNKFHYEREEGLIDG